MRKTIIAANWKMHNTLEEGLNLAVEIKQQLLPADNLEAVLCTPYIHLYHMHELFKDVAFVAIGAQNCHQETHGAYTGEVSAGMLKGLNIQYVILGHSERRQYFGETDTIIRQKVDQALAAGLKPIYCCGEPLEVRHHNAHHMLVHEQISEALFHLTPEQIQQVVIAYEPVWAIGTGVVATPDQAQDMHAFIRRSLAQQFGEQVANAVSILYGGSMKPDNAAELLALPDVDGGLIGGASLKADQYLAIYNAARG